MLDRFNQIAVENPIDSIISQIRMLITSGQLAPGEKLPPERKLAEKFGVGRSMVRDAIRKLEFYGIVKTLPQSGTRIEGLGLVALESLITDVLNMEEVDFASLVETRVLLEVKAAGKAAIRRTPDDLVNMENTLSAYEDKVHKGHSGVEEDLLFHIKIAEASGNTVLKSLMMIITPDILKSHIELKVCAGDRVKQAMAEHREILRHIINQDKHAAEQSMKSHLHDITEFSQKEINKLI